jgi:hypothetical protein
MAAFPPSLEWPCISREFISLRLRAHCSKFKKSRLEDADNHASKLFLLCLTNGVDLTFGARLESGHRNKRG